MKLYELPSGDTAYRYGKSIVLTFAGKRRVLSTSLFNGGIHDDYLYVFNHDANPGAGIACTLSAPTYEEHMAKIATGLGLDATRTTGMGTAARMENVAIASQTHENLTITAFVTAGIEVNGGRVGDPATYFKPIKQGERLPIGTINIMLFIDGDMKGGTMARALVTCTEAKSAALQELMAGSNYSTGLATGSGTDQTIIIANSESPWYYDGAGKHNKVGELIGRVVKCAVTEALEKQNGLTPASQHNVFKRLKRYGITTDTLYEIFSQKGRMPKYEFAAVLAAWAEDSEAVVLISLFVHLLDQWQWKLITDEELLWGFSLLQGEGREKREKGSTLCLTDIISDLQQYILRKSQVKETDEDEKRQDD